MQLPQIRQQSSLIQMEMLTTPATVEIEQPPAEVSIEQPKPDVLIETTPGKLTIDQTQAWEDMDLKHIFRRIEEAAELGYKDWLDGLERRSQQGDELMRIENRGNPIAKQAKENSERPLYEKNIGFIPSHFSVKTDYEPAQVHIDVQVHRPIIEVEVHRPIIRYQPGDVYTAVMRSNSLEIDFENLKFVGNNFEIEI
ncbi:DUF6470 family protein [Bacillus sp. SCS-151]|uniref:DUF6470 family protein n=1 Tax=Nanhaiella sioensis TaxID=3115293 RepID=UPI00397A088B